MVSARQLIFYIRAEDQASRVVRRAATSFGSLSNINALQRRASEQQIRNLRNIEKAQLAIIRNQNTLNRAQVTASRLGRFVSAGKPIRGYTIAETQQLHEVALSNVATLTRNAQLLAAAEDDVRRTGDAASASLSRQISSAQIARTEQWVTGLQGVARAFRLIGIAAAASLAFAAHSAAQFQTQVTLAATQARPPGAPISTTANISTRVQEQILKLMQQFPATAKQMSDSFYQIFSGTNIQSVKQATQYVKLFSEAAVGGGASLDEMTQAGISIRNVFGIGLGGEFKNMTQALNVFFAAVRYGRMTASQFAQALGYISPIAKDVQLSFRNIAEDMAFFTRQTGGRMTRQDAQGLARLIQLFARSDVATGLAQKGIPVFDKVTGKMRPIVEIIKQIHDQLKLTPQETVNFFKTISAAGSGKAGTQGTIQAIRIFSQGIQNAKAYQQVVSNVRVDNNEFIRSYNALSKTPGVRWQVFVNQLKAAVIVIGSQAIPAIVRLSKPVIDGVKAFNRLSESTKHTIAVIGVFGSVALVLGGTLTIIAGAFFKLWLTIKEIRLASLAAETGSVSAAFALWAPALVGVSLLLIKYPHLISNVTNAMGGLHGVIRTVIIVLGVLSGMKIATWLSGLEVGAVRAAAEISLVQRELLALTSLSPYIITIIALYEPIKRLAKDFRSQHPGVAKIADAFPVVGPVFEAGGAVGERAGKAFDNWLARIYPTWKQKVSQMHAKMRKDAMTIETPLQVTASTAPAQLEQILASRMASDFDKAQARLAFIKKDYAELARILRSVTLPTNVGDTTTLDSVHKKVVATAKSTAWQQLFDNVIRLDKIVQAQKVPTLKSLEALLNAEDALQKASTGNQYQAAQQMLSALESTWNTAEKSAIKHGKNLLKIEKQNVQNAKTELGNLLQGVQSLYDNILSQNQSMFGDLFAGPVVGGARMQDRLQFGGQITGMDLLKDIKAQTFQFNRVNRELKTLSVRGAPKALLDQIRALGPGARDDIKALTKLTPQEFKQYVNAWNAGQKAIKNNTISQLDGQLKIYEGFGRKVAAAILKGIRSQDPKLQNELEQIVLKMFPGLAKQAKEGFKFKHVPKPAKEPKLPSYAIPPRHRRTLQDVQYKLPQMVRGSSQLNTTTTNNISRMVNHNNITNAPHTSTSHHATSTHNLTNNYQTSRNTNDNRKMEEHTHYHLEVPHGDPLTKIRHLEFSRRNRYKGNL